jgi:hypothetical protein
MSIETRHGGNAVTRWKSIRVTANTELQLGVGQCRRWATVLHRASVGEAECAVARWCTALRSAYGRRGIASECPSEGQHGVENWIEYTRGLVGGTTTSVKTLGSITRRCTMLVSTCELPILRR